MSNDAANTSVAARSAPGHERLRGLLESDRVLHAPGCTDAVSAKMVQAAGFEVAYLSGAVISATSLGMPDLGYSGAADHADHARRITAATDLPVIVDADTGYGNAVHAARTVELYRRAGVAGLHIEDQISPKRCGHMRGKDVIDVHDAVQKIRAAVEASAGTVVVIARTDAASVLGEEAAIERAGAFEEAGADMVFVEGVSDPEGLARIRAALPSARLVLNRSEAGPYGDHLNDEALHNVGVRVVIHPVSAMLAAAAAMQATYDQIATDGHARTDRMAWSDLNDLLDLPTIEQSQHRYS